jgi:hypothetical protein
MWMEVWELAAGGFRGHLGARKCANSRLELMLHFGLGFPFAIQLVNFNVTHRPFEKLKLIERPANTISSL